MKFYPGQSALQNFQVVNVVSQEYSWYTRCWLCQTVARFGGYQASDPRSSPTHQTISSQEQKSTQIICRNTYSTKEYHHILLRKSLAHPGECPDFQLAWMLFPTRLGLAGKCTLYCTFSLASSVFTGHAAVIPSSTLCPSPSQTRILKK